MFSFIAGGWQFSASQSQFFTSSPQWFLITRGRPPQPVSLQLSTKNLSEGIRARENLLKTSQCIWRRDCGCKKKILNEDTLSWWSTLPESHLCGRWKPHGGEKQLCEQVNDLLHLRLYLLLCALSFMLRNRCDCVQKSELCCTDMIAAPVPCHAKSLVETLLVISSYLAHKAPILQHNPHAMHRIW